MLILVHNPSSTRCLVSAGRSVVSWLLACVVGTVPGGLPSLTHSWARTHCSVVPGQLSPWLCSDVGYGVVRWPSRSFSIFLWKISLALDIPKAMRVMQNRPWRVMGVVSFAHSSTKASCQYPPEASSFEKQTEPASFASTCGIAEIMYISRYTTLFSCLRSMQLSFVWLLWWFDHWGAPWDWLSYFLDNAISLHSS